MKGKDKSFLPSPLFYYFSAFIKFKHNNKETCSIISREFQQISFFQNKPKIIKLLNCNKEMLRKINLVYRSVALHKVSPLCTALTQQPRQQHLSSDLSLCSQNHAFASAVLQDAINSEKNRYDNSDIIHLFQRAQAHNNHRLTF